MAFDEKFVDHIIANYPGKKDFVAFDIGANIGKYTNKLAAKFGKVYAFEVCDSTCDILRNNTKNMDNIEVINAGICDIDDDSVKMYIQGGDPKGRGGNTLSYYVAEQKKWGHNPEKYTTVKGMKLDTFVKANRIDNLRLIKMDIEGGENFAWKGAIETLRNNKLDIILEVHNCVNYKELYQFFEHHGYAMYNSNGTPSKEFRPDTHYLITNRHK